MQLYFKCNNYKFAAGRFGAGRFGAGSFGAKLQLRRMLDKDSVIKLFIMLLRYPPVSSDNLCFYLDEV